jgi:hypothetical protein
MKLHNLCLDRNVDIPNRHFVDDMNDGDDWVVYDTYQDDDAALRGYTRGECHRLLTHKLEQLGVARPIHASMNSRCGLSIN